MQFLIDHYDEILALLGTTYALVCGVVALTPTKEDDRALARFQQWISFIPPRNVPGIVKLPFTRPKRGEDAMGPMLAVLLCIAPALGGCAQRAKIDTLMQFVRGASCAVCDKLGGEAGCERPREAP